MTKVSVAGLLVARGRKPSLRGSSSLGKAQLSTGTFGRVDMQQAKLRCQRSLAPVHPFLSADRTSESDRSTSPFFTGALRGVKSAFRRSRRTLHLRATVNSGRAVDQQFYGLA